VLGYHAKADEAAPVLADQRDASQAESVECEPPHPLHMPRVAVIGDLRGLVRPAEPDHIGRDRPQSGVGEHRDHRAVQEGPTRLAVGRAGLHVGHAQAADVSKARLEIEVRQTGEAVLWRSQYPYRSVRHAPIVTLR